MSGILNCMILTTTSLPPVSPDRVRLQVRNQIGVYVDLDAKFQVPAQNFKLFMDYAKTIWVQNILGKRERLDVFDPTAIVYRLQRK